MKEKETLSIQDYLEELFINSEADDIYTHLSLYLCRIAIADECPYTPDTQIMIFIKKFSCIYLELVEKDQISVFKNVWYQHTPNKGFFYMTLSKPPYGLSDDNVKFILSKEKVTHRNKELARDICRGMTYADCGRKYKISAPRARHLYYNIVRYVKIRF